MKAIRLRTEYLVNPLGMDMQRPRLFWNCVDGIKQTAYQIVSDQWDSGKVESSAMHADYSLPLADREWVIWKVRLWDETDTPGEWSEAAFFEMGITKWDAAWITGNYNVNKKQRYPVDCFRKAFSVKKSQKARLYITACGLYEATLNGHRVGDFILAPGITDYNKRIQYQTYDVTDLLIEGENVLSVQLADGWYRGSTGAWGLKNQYGTETALLCQLEITGKDGKVQIVCSNETWDWSNDGPLRFADNKDGEIVDANRQPSYNGKAKRTSRTVVPTASNNVPVREHERFTPQLIHTPSGKTVLDFGHNIAGYVSFRVQAKQGQKITLTHGEMLDTQGELTLRNIQCSNKRITTPLQKIEYICEEGLNEYKPRFCIFGFQYVQVDGDIQVKPEDFEAIAVYSDMEDTLTFDSSNDLLNRFVSCTRWSTKNNSADLPTDCPTRERHGWTGDAQIFFGTAAYLFDYASFSRKFLNDMYDWQRKDGCLPQIAPAGGVDFYMNTMNGSVGWADAGVIIPYRFWKQYGDERILTQYYPGMRKYARFMMKRCGRLGLLAKPLGLHGENRKYAVNAGQSYGEWAEPAEVHPNKWTDMVAPHPEVSTAYTAYVMGLMAEIAEYLGKTEDADLYRQYESGCKKAYQELVEKPDFSLNTDRQATLVRPLYMNLLNVKQAEFAKNRLLQAVKNYRYRVGTGFLSTPLIMDVIDDIDLDTAYRMLENEEMPGWLFMPKAGATTVWESWEGTQAQGGIASLDHYSKGAVLEWVFRVMCGVQMDGENHFILAPRPGGHFENAGVKYDSIFGPVESGWKRITGKTVYTFSIPANCTATVILPGQKAQELTAGVYRMEAYFAKEWPQMRLTEYHPYIRSRIDQEKMALGYARPDFDVAVLELPYIFGTQPGRKPVWVFLVENIRSMKGVTMWPKGGSTMVTVKQVGQAIAGALERNQGGNCYPIGWYNLTWKEMLRICHKYLGCPEKKIVTIPNWMYAIGGKKLKKEQQQKGIEGGLDMVKFTDLQCSNQFIDKSLGCVPLGVKEDDIDAAIGDSIRLCVDILDGKAKNIVAMKGE